MGKPTRDRIGDVFRRYVTDDGEMKAVLDGQPILTALSLDSLAMLKLITEIEVEFGKRFEMETIEQVLETIDSLTAYMDS
jgi:acyl carrier protein